MRDVRGPVRSTSVAPRGVSRLWIAAFLLPCAVAVGVGLALPARSAPDDEAWKARIERALDGAEATLAPVDEGKAVPGEISARVTALHTRLLALEAAFELKQGTVSGKPDLASLTLDAASLQTRAQAVVAAKKLRSNPLEGESKPPPEERTGDEPPREAKDALKKPDDLAPLRDAGDPANPGAKQDPLTPPRKPEEGARQWPSQVKFKATARMSYVRTGARLKVEIAPDVFEDRFRMDGYEGKISFTLRATNLLRDVKSVVVRVGAKMPSPVNEVSEAVRVNEVTWTADKVLGNDSLESWVNHDSFRYDVKPRWYGGLREGVVNLSVEAWVVSAVLLDGTELKFTVPDFDSK